MSVSKTAKFCPLFKTTEQFSSLHMFVIRIALSNHISAITKSATFLEPLQKLNLPFKGLLLQNYLGWCSRFPVRSSAESKQFPDFFHADFMIGGSRSPSGFRCLADIHFNIIFPFIPQLFTHVSWNPWVSHYIDVLTVTPQYHSL